MKTFFIAFLMSTSFLTAQAQAFSLSMDNLVRDLNFPDPIAEPVTKDKVQPER
ncbi:hypothetical protein [Ruegeria arenilitoris]|uniref:hypothetical protein n=1 Tax=Ruegeria arenilitoris TaxID=1173585 RepID=UPI0014811850|nr:hypothetical protein [Ruegeria arenilitoris]